MQYFFKKQVVIQYAQCTPIFVFFFKCQYLIKRKIWRKSAIKLLSVLPQRGGLSRIFPFTWPFSYFLLPANKDTAVNTFHITDFCNVWIFVIGTYNFLTRNIRIVPPTKEGSPLWLQFIIKSRNVVTHSLFSFTILDALSPSSSLDPTPDSILPVGFLGHRLQLNTIPDPSPVNPRKSMYSPGSYGPRQHHPDPVASPATLISSHCTSLHSHFTAANPTLSLWASSLF